MNLPLEKKKVGRPKVEPYRKRKIRFGYLEDAFHRLLDKVEDPQAIEVIKQELKDLLIYERLLTEEKVKEGKEWL